MTILLPRIAIVGRPNAGKSSIVNALIGEERNIVTNIAGTTAILFILDTTNLEKILFGRYSRYTKKPK